MGAGSAWAVQPQTFTHTTEADFEPGEFENTVATNLGDVKLAADSTPIGEMPAGVTVIYELQQIRETTYLATGPEATLLKRTGDAIETVLTLPGSQFFALAEVNGQLLVGVSGAEAKLSVLHDGKLVDVLTLPESQYIWDIAVMGRDAVVATGPNGKLFKVQDLAGYASAIAKGNPTQPPASGELYDAAQANVLCLALHDQTLYFGTDTDGIVYRLDADGSVFAVYDAAEPEIGSIVVASDGTVYAGTADAEQARPGRMDGAVKDERGRPENIERPIDTDQPPPTPPDVGEPKPMPMKSDTAGTPDHARPAVADRSGDTVASGEQRGSATADAQASAGDQASNAPSAPTPEQYDALRAEVRERLQTARKTGQLTTAPAPGSKSSNNATRPTTAPDQRKQGNAVYRIEPTGFVTEVFRESVMVLDLLLDEQDDTLYVATGSEGQLFRVALGDREVTVVRDFDAEQVLTLALIDGEPLLGTANPASLVALSSNLASKGKYTSKPWDATQPSLWGKLRVIADLAAGTSVMVETRTGNVADPDAGPWSPWSNGTALPDAADALSPRSIEVASPPARYLQYRLTLQNNSSNFSPVIDRVELAYVLPNLPPVVSRIGTKPPAPPTDPDRPCNTVLPVEWETRDDNGDRLTYTLHAQPAGSDTWLKLADDLTATNYDWQTRTMPDGRYLLRVTASDQLDNPPGGQMTAARRSDPVLIDNTPPEIHDLQAKVTGLSVQLTGEAKDALSPIRTLAYKLNDAEAWVSLLPGDLIFDSTSETFEVTILDLSLGSHVLTVRASDAQGNTAYASQVLTVK
jgi:hypothetical protein